MSAKETCFVPTPDGDEVPVGTLIWLDGDIVALADDGGFQDRRSDVGNGIPIPYYGRTATIIAIPDGRGGWIAPECSRVHVPEWVPLTHEQVPLLPDRVPVRVEGCAVVVEGLFSREATRDRGLTLHNDGGYWWTGGLPHAVIHVHPENVPDPDADRSVVAAHDSERDEAERLARAAYAVDRLREVADGRVQHRYEGECPSAVEGHASRDRDCPACAALIVAATWRIDPVPEDEPEPEPDAGEQA